MRSTLCGRGERDFRGQLQSSRCSAEFLGVSTEHGSTRIDNSGPSVRAHRHRPSSGCSVDMPLHQHHSPAVICRHLWRSTTTLDRDGRTADRIVEHRRDQAARRYIVHPTQLQPDVKLSQGRQRCLTGRLCSRKPRPAPSHTMTEDRSVRRDGIRFFSSRLFLSSSSSSSPPLLSFLFIPSPLLTAVSPL